MALEINKLVGGYSQIPVLKDVSFDVQPGELVGLIGLNGAGKSTTLNHVIGLLRPFSGSIKINGLTIQANPEEYKKQIAYVPETPILYDELTLREHIDLTIMAYELDHDAAWQRATKLLKLFRLDNKLDWFPANFSKGMKQKVMICCAFMTKAKLLIIDEPFYGLDPLAVHDLLDLIEQKKKEMLAVADSVGHFWFYDDTEFQSQDPHAYWLMNRMGTLSASGIKPHRDTPQIAKGKTWLWR